MDIDFPYHFDGRGRTATTDRDDHVRDMIEQLIFTNPGERVNRPDFGCGIRRMVFAPNSEVSASLAEVMIFEALKRWLDPAISVSDVRNNAVNERLEIRIAYVLKARGERRYLNLEITL